MIHKTTVLKQKTTGSLFKMLCGLYDKYTYYYTVICLVFYLDYDLSKLRDFIDQQADTYVEKGILDQEEANAIKRIYSSL